MAEIAGIISIGMFIALVYACAVVYFVGIRGGKL